MCLRLPAPIAGLHYDSNILSVTIDGTTALVNDCSRDTGEGYSRETGELLIEAEENHKIRTTELQYNGESWKVINFYGGGNLTCDPDQS